MLIAKDPGAYWDTATNKVEEQRTGTRARGSSPIPLYDPIFYDNGQAERPQRGPQVRSIGSASSSTRIEGNDRGRPHHPAWRAAARHGPAPPGLHYPRRFGWSQ